MVVVSIKPKPDTMETLTLLISKKYVETFIGKSIDDTDIGIKWRTNNYISESRTGISSCKFPRHVYQWVIKNGNLNELFSEINFMLAANDPVRWQYLENHFQNKGYRIKILQGTAN